MPSAREPRSSEGCLLGIAKGNNENKKKCHLRSFSYISGHSAQQVCSLQRSYSNIRAILASISCVTKASNARLLQFTYVHTTECSKHRLTEPTVYHRPCRKQKKKAVFSLVGLRRHHGRAPQLVRHVQKASADA